MKKLRHLFLFTLILFIAGCEQDADTPEAPSQFLDGWEISHSAINFDINPRDLFFVNDALGFVVGYNGEIYKTTDAGKSWQKQNSGTSLHLFSVFFLNEQTGFAAGHAMNCLDADCGKGSVLLKTTNGGNTWTKIFLKDYIRIYSLHFFDEQNGLALLHRPDVPNSKDEFIARTTDGGNTWTLTDLAVQPYNNVFYVDDLVFVTGENQKIFKSTDRGLSWKVINTPVPAWHNIRDIYFYNERIGFLDGVTHFYKTTNGGLSWQLMTASFKAMDLFHFYNENEGFNIESVFAYQGGDFPTFQGVASSQTENGGANWIKGDLTGSFYPGLSFFPRRNLGYLLGRSEFYTIRKQ